MNHRLIRIAAVCTLSACLGDPLAPALDPTSVHLRLESSVSLCTQEVRNQQPTISSGDGAIRASAVLGVPSGGYELVADLLVDPERKLIITVTGMLNGGGIALVLCHPYTLVVSPVPPGPYDVLLVHDLSSANRSAEVLSTRVHVR